MMSVICLYEIYKIYIIMITEFILHNYQVNLYWHLSYLYTCGDSLDYNCISDSGSLYRDQ